ncbi:MAG: hypothetical protein U0821_04035 [Chloroflexota bacterium]
MRFLRLLIIGVVAAALWIQPILVGAPDPIARTLSASERQPSVRKQIQPAPPPRPAPGAPVGSEALPVVPDRGAPPVVPAAAPPPPPAPPLPVVPEPRPEVVAPAAAPPLPVVPAPRPPTGPEPPVVPVTPSGTNENHNHNENHDDNHNDNHQDNGNYNGNYNDNEDDDNDNEDNDNGDNQNGNDNEVVVVNPYCSRIGQTTEFYSADGRVVVTVTSSLPVRTRVEIYATDPATVPGPVESRVGQLTYQLVFLTCDGFAYARLPGDINLGIHFTDDEVWGQDPRHVTIFRRDVATETWVAVPKQVADPPARYVSASIAEPGVYDVQIRSVIVVP